MSNPTTTETPDGKGTVARAPDPWVSIPVSIQRITQEAPGVKTYDLSFDDPTAAERYSWRPGQFNMLYVPGAGEIAISICGDAPERGVIRHTIRKVGSVTRFFDEAEVGTSIGLRGPFGSAWPVAALEASAGQGREVIVVAGGIGLVPLRPVLVHILRNPELAGRLSLLTGTRTPKDLLFRSEFDLWREQGAKIQLTVDRAVADWSGHVGVVTLLLERLSIDRADDAIVMMCGPEVMMRYVAQCAIDRGIQPENIWVSLERHMNCAVGLCGHCQLGPVFMCKDGPVFSYDQISEWLHVEGF